MPAGRPRPPPEVLDPLGDAFIPAPELLSWAVETFIVEDAPLRNEDHAHLEHATLAFLWTGVSNVRQGRRILGQAELGQPRGTMGKWPKARAEQQLIGWFGDVPDFLITIEAANAEHCDDDEFCALIEHELYHCGQERDEFGAPKFTQDGRPKFGMRGHDVEEFVGVVRRYGADAAGVRALVDAAMGKPAVARASIQGVCGTCLLKAA
jgi:hypothetical protein